MKCIAHGWFEIGHEMTLDGYLDLGCDTGSSHLLGTLRQGQLLFSSKQVARLCLLVYVGIMTGKSLW